MYFIISLPLLSHNLPFSSVMSSYPGDKSLMCPLASLFILYVCVLYLPPGFFKLLDGWNESQTVA